MTANENIKQQLHTYCQEHTRERLETLLQSNADLQSTLADETKSSAGDKYETSRSMLHQEIEKNNFQIQQAQKDLRMLQSIGHVAKSKLIKPGSLVLTDAGQYYVAIALGLSVIDKKEFLIISPGSPIGQVLIDLQKGQQFSFRNKTHTILGVI